MNKSRKCAKTSGCSCPGVRCLIREECRGITKPRCRKGSKRPKKSKKSKRLKKSKSRK